MKPIGVILAALAVLLLSCAGCAAFKKDVKTVADVCRPELEPDVAQMLPLVIAYAACEAQGLNCSEQAAAIVNAGKQDAATCAAAELHAATVKVSAAIPDAGTP